MRPGQSGTGPGPIAPDGSPVRLYTLLRPQREPDIVRDAVPAGARILELGCGAGRVTAALVGAGYEVVAVDESPDMIAAMRDRIPAESAAAVVAHCSTIERLDLGERFEVVLLGSHLINMGGVQLRDQLLAACARHLQPTGVVLIEQHDPEFLASPLVRDRGTTRFVVRDIEPVGPDATKATLEYHLQGEVWTQTITVYELDERMLAASLARAGLRLDRYLTEDRTWLRAVPAADPDPDPDPDAEVATFLRRGGAGETEHSGRTLLEHLAGTARLLREWGCAPHVVTAGLAHSVYGTERFTTALVSAQRRAEVRSVLGPAAEHLVHRFATTRRGSLLAAARSGGGQVQLLDGEWVVLPEPDLAQMCQLTAANAVEQLPPGRPLPGGYRHLLARLDGPAAEAVSELLPDAAGAQIGWLAACVGDPEKFRTHIWGRTPSVHRPNHPEREALRRLLPLPDLDALIEAGLGVDDFRLLRDGKPLPPSRYLPPARDRAGSGRVAEMLTAAAEPDLVVAAVRNGAVLVCTDLHTRHAGLRGFARAMAGELGHACRVDVCVLPPGSTWRVAAKATDRLLVTVTGGTCWSVPELGPGPERLDIGDSLYLPAGSTGETERAGSDTVVLDMEIQPHTWAEVLERGLRALLGGSGQGQDRLDAGWFGAPEEFVAELGRRWQELVGPVAVPADCWGGHPYWSASLSGPVSAGLFGAGRAPGEEDR